MHRSSFVLDGLDFSYVHCFVLLLRALHGGSTPPLVNSYITVFCMLICIVEIKPIQLAI